MKRITIVILTLLSVHSFAQSSLGKTDDLGRIAIAAIVPDEAEIPAGTQRMLQNKLTQIVTLNGLGSVEGSQFALVPMVSVINQDVTPTAPPQIALTVEVSLYIVDAISRNIFSQTSIEIRGVGRTEERAYAQALNNLNPRHGQFRGFVEKGKEKIVEYYNSKCDVILSSAKALAGQKKYEEALHTLMSVPDISRECYDMSMNLSLDIYQEYANHKCNEYLSAARAAWAGKELSAVEENLGKITPDMACYSDAEQFMAQITAAVEAEGGSAWNFKMKKYDDSVDIEKMKIQAGKEVAQSWAYYGASSQFDWSWMYPNAKKKVVEQPKLEVQPEPQKAKEPVATPQPIEEKRPPIGERPKASELVVPYFKDKGAKFDDKIGLEEYSIVTSNATTKTIVGVIRRQFCIAPEGFSPLEIVRFYQSFIESRGKIIYQTRNAESVVIDGQKLSKYLHTQALSHNSSYEYMAANCEEYLVGVIYTDTTDLYVVVGAGRAGGKPTYHLITIEVAQ